jgi:hypothetical protein
MADSWNSVAYPDKHAGRAQPLHCEGHALLQAILNSCHTEKVQALTEWSVMTLIYICENVRVCTYVFIYTYVCVRAHFFLPNLL